MAVLHMKGCRDACWGALCNRNLHDVFINIRDDEGEHVKTMRACQVTVSRQQVPSVCICES